MGAVSAVSTGLSAMATAPRPEFDGPGGVWSPETLLIAAIADCFILTFRGVSQFVRYITRATLTVQSNADHAKARELLERAEKLCLVANSLLVERALEVQVREMAAV